MERVTPWVIGAAFAVTVGIVYIACAVAVLLFPDATLAFFNTWMHGIDLTVIKRDPASPLTFNEWGTGFVTAVVGGFLAGAIYGWARNLFMRLDTGSASSRSRVRKVRSQGSSSYGH